MVDTVGSFFGGQMLHYAGEAGELAGKLKVALAEIEARKRLQDDMVKIISELAPSHPLLKNDRKEIREKLNDYYRQELKKTR